MDRMSRMKMIRETAEDLYRELGQGNEEFTKKNGLIESREMRTERTSERIRAFHLYEQIGWSPEAYLAFEESLRKADNENGEIKMDNQTQNPIAIQVEGTSKWVIQDLATEKVARQFTEALNLVNAGDDNQGKSDLVAVLREHPRHMDAMHHLALVYERQGRTTEYRALTREAGRIALEALPSTFDNTESRMEFRNLSNRPFYRAVNELGRLLAKEGDETGAQRLWQMLLRVNPNDDQDCRHELLYSLLRCKQWEQVILHGEWYRVLRSWSGFAQALAYSGLGKRENTIACLEASTKEGVMTAALIIERADLVRYIEQNDILGRSDDHSHWEENKDCWKGPEAALAREILTENIEKWVRTEVPKKRRRKQQEHN